MFRNSFKNNNYNTDYGYSWEHESQPSSEISRVCVIRWYHKLIYGLPNQILSPHTNFFLGPIIYTSKYQSSNHISKWSLIKYFYMHLHM